MTQDTVPTGTSAGTQPAAARLPWLDRLAHDLRGPLAPLSTGLVLIQSGRLDATQQADLLATMQRQIDNLTQLIDDAGELIAARSPTPAAVALAGLLDMARVRGLRRLQALGASLHFVDGGEAQVRGDARDLLRLILLLAQRLAEQTTRPCRIQIGVQAADGRVQLDFTTEPVADDAAALAALGERLANPSDSHLAEAILRELLRRNEARVCVVEGALRLELVAVT